MTDPRRRLPPLDAGWAFFLDVDGIDFLTITKEGVAEDSVKF